MHNFEWFHDKHSITTRIGKDDFFYERYVRKNIYAKYLYVCKNFLKNVRKKRFFAVFHKKMKSGDPALVLDKKSMDRIHFVTINGTNQRCRQWVIS